MRVNGRPVMRVEYLFDALTGRMTGQGSSFSPPPIGATIWVLHDPFGAAAERDRLTGGALVIVAGLARNGR